MSNQLIEFTTDKRFVRRVRELKTIEAMVRMYCRHHHGDAPLCADCAALFDYARRRLQRCVFGDAKPTCAKCVVHCYSAEMREKVRIVMRWAGPRMLLRHPILGVSHLLDGRRPTPMLPAKRQAKATTTEQSGNDQPDAFRYRATAHSDPRDGND
jgi:Nitrous oxide-stimulated promoter